MRSSNAALLARSGRKHAVHGRGQLLEEGVAPHKRLYREDQRAVALLHRQLLPLVDDPEDRAERLPLGRRSAILILIPLLILGPSLILPLVDGRASSPRRFRVDQFPPQMAVAVCWAASAPSSAPSLCALA